MTQSLKPAQAALHLRRKLLKATVDLPLAVPFVDQLYAKPAYPARASKLIRSLSSKLLALAVTGAQATRRSQNPSLLQGEPANFPGTVFAQSFALKQ
jgi:hypothetical protein